MPLQSLFQKKSIFLFYWLLILPLAGYLFYDRYTDHFEEIAPVLEHTTTMGLKATRQANELSLTQVHKWADAFPSSDNKVLRRQAVAALKQTNICQNKIRMAQAKSNSITRAELNQIAAPLRQLADSLLVFIDRDSIVAADLDVLLYQPATELQTTGMTDFFKNAMATQTKLYLDDQIWKTELALQLVLGDISGRVYQDEPRFDDYFPILEVENCAQTGKPFSGKIYLHGYSKHVEHIKYFVDGRECRITAGLVQYQGSFSKPGVHMHRFMAQVINPLTKQIKTFTKDFQITIQEP